MKAMKRLWILALMMVAVQPLAAQMYVDGEVLNFRMSYKAKLLPNIEVASVVIATKDTLLEGREVHKVYGHGATENMYHWILPVNDTYLVWADRQSKRTVRFDSDLHEGSYTFWSTYLFDHEKGVVNTRWQSRQRPIKERQLAISDRGMDPISLYFNLRAINPAEVKEGWSKDLEMVLEDTVRKLNLRYEGREVKKIKRLGKFNTLKFRCNIATSSGFAFTDGTEFELWISDDRNKLPLYIKSPIRVGSVCAYLSSFEGLRYPLESKVD
jgi:hypothetical protein